MAEVYFELSRRDRLNMLAYAENETNRPAAHLEKDIWVVWCLQKLFCAFFANALVFKGGTSLSKAFSALIRRFSEDVDLACVIHYFAPDLVDYFSNMISPDRFPDRDMPKMARVRLRSWVRETIVPFLEEELAKTEPKARILVTAQVTFGLSIWQAENGPAPALTRKRLE